MEELKSLTNDVKDYPELIEVIDTVTQIFEMMSTDEMIELKRTNVVQYEQVIHDKFPVFCDKHFSLVSSLLDGDIASLGNLVLMIKTICMVKTGQISMDTANSHIREELSSQYIYPKFGGKKEFEKTIIERSKKNKKHK